MSYDFEASQPIGAASCAPSANEALFRERERRERMTVRELFDAKIVELEGSIARTEERIAAMRAQRDALPVHVSRMTMAEVQAIFSVF